jgi:hypothetical protein
MPTPEGAETQAAVPTQAARRHALRNAAIAAFLLFQIAMPLRYYLRGGGTDERFSWRMFSSIRMQKCDMSVRETADGQERKVDIDRAVQVAWVGMLERDRPAVVEKFLARRCAIEGVSSVHYHRACQETNGSWSQPLDLVMDCKSGALASQKDAP